MDEFESWSDMLLEEIIENEGSHMYMHYDYRSTIHSHFLCAQASPASSTNTTGIRQT
jgi:hypothetical protein